MMKTTYMLELLICLIIFTGCSDDNKDNPVITNPITLRITKETQQDQIGDFAENAMAVFNGKVWSVGGKSTYVNPGALTPTVWSSENGVAWVSVFTGFDTDGATFKRKDHSLTVLEDTMYLIGGFNEAGVAINDIWRTYDGADWRKLETETDFALLLGGEHRTVVFNNQLLLANGVSIDDENVVQVLSSPNGINWSRLTANAFPYRGNFDLVVFNNILYAIGGYDVDTNLQNDIYSSTDGITWERVATHSPIFSPRQYFTTTVYNNKVWLIGGQTPTDIALTDIWYSSDMVNWSLYNGLEDDALGLYYHAALNYREAIWLFGGWLQTAPDAGSVALTGQIISIKED